MTIIGAAKGETARRIYAVLHRNPDLTSAEIATHLSDLTPAAVQSALHKMKKRGAVEVRGSKVVRPTATKGPKTAPTYHVKYKSGAVTPPKQKPKPKKVEAPKVEAPKVEAPKKVEYALSDYAKLAEAYKSLAVMYRDTVYELADVRNQLMFTQRALADKVIAERRSWWDKLKDWF
jgi:predicted transcriptional regulator